MPTTRRLAVLLAELPVVVALVVVLVAPTTAAVPDPVGVWPLQPRPQVLAGFDPPDVPWGSGHRGVDLLGRPDQPVYAALDGRITYAGLLAGRGVVVVHHGETRTTYEPVDATVTVGQPVARGQPLGTLSSAGSHCLPQVCLHWGWLRVTTYLDPLDLVGDYSVRLLPLWRQAPAATLGTPPARWVVAPPLTWWLPYAGILPRLLELTARSPPSASLGARVGLLVGAP